MRQFTEEIQAVRRVMEHADVTASVAESSIRDRLKEYIEDGTPPAEAKWSIALEILTYDGHEDPESVIQRHRRNEMQNQTVPLQAVTVDDERADVCAQVIREFETETEAIEQTGVLADGSREVTFVIWSSTGESLEVGEAYYLRSAEVDSYRGDVEVVIQPTTEIIPADDGPSLTSQDGSVVSILSPSGLVKRCDQSDCSRILAEGECSEHGETEGNWDLRIKGILDNGRFHQTIFLNEKMIAGLISLDLTEALRLAEEAISKKPVLRRLREEFLGNYLHVEGDRISDGLYVTSGFMLDRPDRIEITDTREQLKGVPL